ncbi:hypothetical protein MMAG44476_14475 [Mycolicibacterium mageritense DSM 44476 = CIP 104973]|uniref:DUF2188 domain-containing protein n=1 Tax=Mycolicibacterium mageritense TaxID=53462 RepID=A0ABM7HSY7_MYCME|nr:hypothetical protein MMAGJ_29490 [Mycolicibacterium mageritense]GLE54922.1 hypothetical protein NJBCHELONAE_02330 [Mycobacteroides chelonae]CDO22095.1 hypothetical protein BN978_02560 [Mycolicibacterium mageritense DSM 44476 = CIP 104973]
MSARISYNRVTRVVWISDEHGDTVARTEIPRGKRCTDVAGELLAAHGYARTGDYLLAGSGSPIREATIRVVSRHVSRN